MTSVRNQVDPYDDLRVAVLEATRQPTRLDGTGTRIGH